MQINDKVIITVSPDHGKAEGTITDIAPVPPSGDYPIYTVDVPAYGTFTRRADDCEREITVSLFLTIPATEEAAEVAKDIAGSVPGYWPVGDWEVSEG